MTGRYLSPTVDLVFKRLFGTVANKDLTISLLNGVLRLEPGKLIVDLVFNDTHNHLETLKQKKSIVDVRCTDEGGSQYIIEMQNDDYHDFTKRAQYYGACGLASQLKVAEQYGILLPVIFVGIVHFKLFDRHNRYLTNHVMLDKEDLKCDLDLQEYHFIELPKFKKTEDQLETLVDKWIYFMAKAGDIDNVPANLGQAKPFMHAFHVLTQSAWTKEELALYQEQIDARRVELGVLSTALETGRQEGREEGREERSLEVARNLLNQGIDEVVIAKATGLSLDVIKKIKNQN